MDSYHKHYSGEHRLLDFKLKEVWQYRELIVLFARREFVVNYKQTILGPLWIFISPMLTSFTYAFVFGRIAGINTDGTPTLLFYLFSNAAWSLFANSVNSCAETFTKNASIMSKVYFPRLVMALSNLLSALISFALQAIPALCFYFYYLMTDTIRPAPEALAFLPLALLQMGLIGFGAGIVVAALTTKYRDLRILIKFGVTAKVTDLLDEAGCIPTVRGRWKGKLLALTEPGNGAHGAVSIQPMGQGNDIRADADGVLADYRRAGVFGDRTV